MAITFVSTANGGTTSTTSFSITFPGDVQVGDLLILEFVHRGTGNGTLGGDGNTNPFITKHKQFFGAGSPQDFTGHLRWKIATADDVSSPSRIVTCTGLINSCAAGLTVYRGVGGLGSPTEPLNEATLVGEENASGNETQAEITTVTADAWVVLTVVNSPDLAVANQAATDPSALTERFDVQSTGGTDTSIAHASAEKATAGGTGAFTWTQVNAASGSWAYAITPFVTPAALGDALLNEANDILLADGDVVSPSIPFVVMAPMQPPELLE